MRFDKKQRDRLHHFSFLTGMGLAYQLYLFGKKVMKKQWIITTAAATGLLLYFIFKRKNNNAGPELNMQPHGNDRHVTDVFSNAKNYATR